MKSDKGGTYNKKNILRHFNGINPYGLYDQNDHHPLSREETIKYFDEIKLSDKEPVSLNEYVKDDRENSFYNNPFMIFEDELNESSYVDALRIHKKMEPGETPRKFGFECHRGRESWMVEIRNLRKFKGYIRLDIICNGNRFYTYTGNAGGELWICFPQIDKATTLSYPEDLYWNAGELYRLLKNEIDALSIVQSIKRVKHFISQSNDGFDIMEDDGLFKKINE